MALSTCVHRQKACRGRQVTAHTRELFFHKDGVIRIRCHPAELGWGGDCMLGSNSQLCEPIPEHNRCYRFSLATVNLPVPSRRMRVGTWHRGDHTACDTLYGHLTLECLAVGPGSVPDPCFPPVCTLGGNSCWLSSSGF